MAVLTSFNRFTGEIARLVSFNNDSYVIDNKVLNKDLVQINRDPVEIVGNKYELQSDMSWINDYNTTKGSAFATSNWVAQTHYLDISTDNPVFGGTSFSHPDMENENFVLTNRNPSGLTGMRLTKLADDGTIIAAVNITIGNAVFADFDGTYIYLIGFHWDGTAANSQVVVKAYNHNTLTLAKTCNYGQYGPFGPSIIYRTEDRLCVLSRIAGIPYYMNKNASGLSAVAYVKSPDSPSSGNPAALAYNTVTLCNNTAPMANGYTYTLNRTLGSYVATNNISFEGWSFDNQNFQYKYIAPADMNVTFDHDVCDGSAIKCTFFSGGTNTTNHDMMWTCLKMNDWKFVLINTLNICNKNVIGLNWQTRYLVVEVDKDDPMKLTVVNAQFLPYSYVGYPMRHDSQKLMFIYNGVAAHSYTFNDEKNELDLTWEVDTPNIVSACFYNGIFFWNNKSTNELSYEIEGNTLRVEASFDDNDVQLVNSSSPVETTYRLSVYDSDNNRISTQVRLVCKGVIQFVDGSTEKTITTSTSADYTTTVKVLNAGESFIVHTLLQG